MIRIMLSRILGERRMYQSELARKTGIHPNTINDIYNEMTDRVNLEHLDRICEALDIPLSELLVRVPNPIPLAERIEQKGAAAKHPPRKTV